MISSDHQKLPNSCCRVLSQDEKEIIFCDKQACFWYQHNEDICSFCEEHNYQCGEPIQIDRLTYVINKDNLKKYKSHFISYCHLCEHKIIICSTCGNNCCNATYGEVDGQHCSDCPSAYEEQDELLSLK